MTGLFSFYFLEDERVGPSEHQSDIDVLERKIDFSITYVSCHADTRSPLGTINF
jgi:hypothetical protein